MIIQKIIILSYFCSSPFGSRLCRLFIVVENFKIPTQSRSSSNIWTLLIFNEDDSRL